MNDARKFVRDFHARKKNAMVISSIDPRTFTLYRSCVLPPTFPNETNKYIQLMAILVERDENNSENSFIAEILEFF